MQNLQRKENSSENDIFHEFNKRLENFEFKSVSPPIREWNGSTIVRDTYNLENLEMFKSTEDRLMYRLELWINMCRVETNKCRPGTIRHRTNSAGNSVRYTTEINKQGLRETVSMDELDIYSIPFHPSYSMQVKEKTSTRYGKMFDGFFKSKLPKSTSSSENDLPEYNHVTVDTKLTSSISSPSISLDEKQTAPLSKSRYSKRKFLFNIFGKKREERKRNGATEKRNIVLPLPQGEFEEPMLYRPNMSTCRDESRSISRSVTDLTTQLNTLQHDINIDSAKESYPNRRNNMKGNIDSIEGITADIMKLTQSIDIKQLPSSASFVHRHSWSDNHYIYHDRDQQCKYIGFV